MFYPVLHHFYGAITKNAEYRQTEKYVYLSQEIAISFMLNAVYIICDKKKSRLSFQLCWIYFE